MITELRYGPRRGDGARLPLEPDVICGTDVSPACQRRRHLTCITDDCDCECHAE